MKNIISEIELKYSPIVIKQERISIKDSSSAYKVLLNNWNMDSIELYEEFKVLLLNRANEVLGVYALSKGGIHGTVVDIKLLFAVVLKSASSCVILAHNHPSGNLKPSEADKNLYFKIKRAAEYLDINVLDNLIISKDGYYSFNDEGE
ncbi:JAB domain-containing protein [Mariniflexile gromovii]|uniref:JAB domain-containing protein n=1 Tax=Mariniflexile gromovii TaxID=362523 RepID=A0ABS4BZM5_9FLAO|nr:JAB domain-containing protein [Mariniflexile gromovii]MBP0905590.1 JAB domain-containing protein [Mariniflexile gromovii]